jgi:hypothetical protein
MSDPTVLLDLAATISNAALTITRHNLAASAPAPSFLAESSNNGPVNGNGAAKAKDSKSELAQKEALDAAASLIQASTDLQILVSGPENYLKSLSYGVRLF